jgi:hypothetical protein
MNKNIIVEYIYIYSKNNSINKFLNENKDECLICFSTLTKVDVVMVNNFCKCYNNILICNKCFKRWYLTDTRCFVCREKYMTYQRNIHDTIFIINPMFRVRHSLVCKDFENIRNQILKYSQSHVINIDDDNQITEQQNINNNILINEEDIINNIQNILNVSNEITRIEMQQINQINQNNTNSSSIFSKFIRVISLLGLLLFIMGFSYLFIDLAV